MTEEEKKEKKRKDALKHYYSNKEYYLNEMKRYREEHPEVMKEVEEKVRKNFDQAFQNALVEDKPKDDEDEDEEDDIDEVEVADKKSTKSKK